MRRSGYLGRTAALARTWAEWAESPGKFVFGSDWPLAHVAEYRDFVRQIFPPADHAAVFAGTARKLFKL